MKIIQETNFEKARKEIQKTKDAIFCSDDDELNRKILEKCPPKILLLNQAKRKDFSKQRNSGFNQVLAKIAKKNRVIVGINLNEIVCANLKEKAEIISRVKQNIKLCAKNKVKMTFISEKDFSRHDLRGLGLSLGMPSWMIIFN